MENITTIDLCGILNITEKEAKSLCETSPYLLKTSKQLLHENVSKLTAIGLNREDIKKLIFNNSHFMFFYSCMLDEYIAYFKSLNITSSTDWINALYNNDIAIKNESFGDFYTRIEEAKQKLNLTNEAVKNILMNTELFGNKVYKDAIYEKIAILNCFGLSVNELPCLGILNNKPEKMILKLKLAAINDVDWNTFITSKYLTSPEKIYARTKAYMQGMMNYKTIYDTELSIKMSCGFTTDELKEKFPLNLEANEEINTIFNYRFPTISKKLSELNSAPTQDSPNPNLEHQNYENMKMFFNKMYDLSDAEFDTMIKFCPNILTADINKIIKNINALKNKFNNLPNTKFKKLITNNPYTFMLKPEKTDDLYWYLKRSFNISDEKFTYILINGHSYYKYSQDEIDRYCSSLKSICGFNDNDVAHFILDTASVCIMDPYAINAKIALLNKFGVDVSKLKNKYQQTSYNILGQRFVKIESRLKLASILNYDPATFLSSSYFLSESTLLRRYMYLSSINPNANILMQKQDFENTYKIGDNALLKLYPDTGAALDYLNDKFTQQFPTLHKEIKDMGILFKENPLAFNAQINHNNENLIRKQVEPKMKIYNMSSNPEQSYTTYKKLNRYFQITSQEYETLLKTLPNIEKMPTGDVLNNFSTLTKMGLTSHQIVARPNVLTSSPQILQLKAALCSLTGNSPTSFLSSNYKQAANKTYARFKYLEGLNSKQKLIYTTEDKFEEQTGLDNELLLNMYPLNADHANLVMQQYEEFLKQKEELDAN